MEQKEQFPESFSGSAIRRLPAVPLRGLTILPDLIIHFDLSRPKSIVAVEQAMIREEKLFLITQKQPETEDPGTDELYRVGSIAAIRQVSKLPNGIVRILVEGEKRGTLLGFLGQEEEFLFAEVEEVPSCEGEVDEITQAAMIRQLAELFAGYSFFYPKIGHNFEKQFQLIKNLERLMDLLTMSIPLEYASKQKVLELPTLRERYDFLTSVLSNEIEIARVKVELTEQLKNRVEKNQKEYLLREQLSYIQGELGEDDPSDAQQLETAAGGLEARQEIKDRILKEIARFRLMHGNSMESAMQRTYIELLLELPWDKTGVDRMDLIQAEKVLEEQHYGLEQVKTRILEFLAVRSLTKGGDSPIICLVGPPGTGKTSVAKSVAEALGKKYVRISLGGVRDEAEIRGHRRTYVGAMPGRIAGALRQAGVKNPLILLDEIDKASGDYKGDTSAALLEVLDSEQNSRFRDHYVELPIDLSEVLFIATANSASSIPRPLLDRMEIMEVHSYTANEKFHIAKEHLVAKQWKKNGLSRESLTISDGAIRKIIQGYTKEAGVREVERKLGEICRKAAVQILKSEGSRKGRGQGAENPDGAAGRGESRSGGTYAGGSCDTEICMDEVHSWGEPGGEDGSGGSRSQTLRKEETRREEESPRERDVSLGKEARHVTTKNLEKYLGKPKYRPNVRNETDEVGIVRGLAWTSVGGETLQIEVNMMPGKGEIELTGQMGDVMKESAITGMSYVRSVSKKHQIKQEIFRKHDFHIHIPEGAVPKDGPSAGITMATALLSAITGVPVYADVAMTGEITLRGRVLPIGGLKEKLLAAKAAGMKKVLVPEKNRRDVEEISKEIRSGLEIVFVEKMEQVIAHALRQDVS
ncbi:MAG: endopeptidase La [Clostridium sp.]|jgi:ATP-dependent Lon protease|nr:endopeptidase La [Clostridium sp.]